VDLDVEEPNSSLFVHAELRETQDTYKMTPEWNASTCTLCGNCQAVCNFNAVLKMGTMVMVFPELCHGCYACSELCPTGSLPMKQQKMGELNYYASGNLSFVESRLSVGEEQAVPLIKQTLSYVEKGFPSDITKIYDCPPGTSCPVIESTRSADLVVLITEPTPFGLHDLKLAVETVRKLQKPFVVVINRNGIGDNGVEVYCNQEKIEIIAYIPNDRLIAEAYSKGELLYSTIPSVRDAIESISTYIDNFRFQNKEQQQ
jgi:MinD superfamily P-loop ATPase